MTKKEFVNATADKAGVKAKEVENIMDAMSDIILDAISKNDSVKFGDVCTFKGVDKPARTARNPKTGDTIQIPAKSGQPKAVFTKAAKE